MKILSELLVYIQIAGIPASANPQVRLLVLANGRSVFMSPDLGQPMSVKQKEALFSLGQWVLSKSGLIPFSQSLSVWLLLGD